MTPTMEEVAGWLRQAGKRLHIFAEGINEMSQGQEYKSQQLNFAELCFDRAARIEAMGTPKTCDTCESYREYYEQVANYMRMTNTCADGYAINQGPKFGCIHHKNMPQPPVKE